MLHFIQGDNMKKLVALLAATLSGALTLTAATPVVVWDGASLENNFSTLTKTVGDNTYTLTVNENASVAADGSYITIGTENQKKTVTITANSEASAPFGSTSASGFSAIIRASKTATSLGSNRAIINFYSANQEAGSSIGQKPGGYAFPFVNGGAFPDYATSEPVFTSGDDIQSIALTYGTNPQGGTAIYVNGVQVYQAATMTSSYFTTPTGVSVGGMGIDGSGKMYALQGMKIYAIAVFTNRLTAAEVAAYTFPSVLTGETTVSAINALYGTASEIDVYLADGVKVTGDTTFNASTVHFHCEGSFSMTAPENNEATFDFSDVVGQPILVYRGAVPSVSGSNFTSNSIPAFVTDAAQWTGTIWLKETSVVDFNPNNYGNASSTVRLSGVSGYFANGSIACDPAIELVNDSYNYGLDVNNGYSRDASNSDRQIVMSRLKGTGALWTSVPNKGQTVLMQILDWSEFSGPVQLVNKIVVFGSYLPPVAEFNTSGGIYIGTQASVTLGSQWRADGGIHVYGTLKATGVGTDQIRDGTVVHTYDSGKFVLVNSSDVNNEASTNFGNIRGTGTIRYESDGNYFRILSQNNFPTNMTVEVELQNGLVIPNPNVTNVIGSLSGKKNIRSDWNTGNRDLKILQAKNTEWRGIFANEDRLGSVVVAPGVSSAGTLTLSGTQTASNGLAVESGAAVNLTGTWVGNVDVAGTIGGTGTITGNLTVDDGFISADQAVTGPLNVSGDVTFSGAIAVVYPEGTTLSSRQTLMTAGGSMTAASGATFAVKAGSKTIGIAGIYGNTLRTTQSPFILRIR